MSIDDHQHVSNSSASKIQKAYKCILECLTAPTPLVQSLSIPAPFVPVPSGLAPSIQTLRAKEAFLAYIPPIQTFSESSLSATNEPSCKQHEKHQK